MRSKRNSTDPDKAAEQQRLDRVLARFNAQVKTDEDAFELLIEQAEKCQLHCCKCGQKVERSYGQRTAYCQGCRHTTHVLAPTIFHDIRVPKAWILAIWLKEEGIEISANEFSRLAGIAGSTAQHIFKVLMDVILFHMPKDALKFLSANFAPVIGKRSRK